MPKSPKLNLNILLHTLLFVAFCVILHIDLFLYINCKVLIMNPFKKLLGQTAIYGLPSILGRFLNYCLVFLHTNIFVTSNYGVQNYFYAIAAFMAVVLLMVWKLLIFDILRFPTTKIECFLLHSIRFILPPYQS